MLSNFERESDETDIVISMILQFDQYVLNIRLTVVPSFRSWPSLFQVFSLIWLMWRLLLQSIVRRLDVLQFELIFLWIFLVVDNFAKFNLVVHILWLLGDLTIHESLIS